MELSTEQKLRLAALQSRRRAAAAPVMVLVSTLDIRASESTRLVTSALTFLAVSAGVLGLRGTESLINPPATSGDLPVSRSAPAALFTLPPLTPVTSDTSDTADTSGTADTSDTADTGDTRGTAAVAVPAEPVANPTYTDTARVDSITQAT